jgi:hypothetical protein
MERKITNDIKIVYFTIGFISSFTAKNLIKVPIPERNYPTFHYYKAHLSIEVMDMFPEEQHFIFTDTDILFSPRLDFSKLKFDYAYPLAVFGPHEYPLIWERINGEIITFDETRLMKYLNVPKRTLMYQWSCFYTFNRNSYDFFEEYASLCKSEYLIKRRKDYFPFHDETPFNVCLWKRNAEHSLGYAFVNTHLLDTVKLIEETTVKDRKLGKNLDQLGSDWEYIHDSNDILFYHGFKEEEPIKEVLNYLLSRQ